MGKVRDYIQKGLVAAVLTGASVFGGCGVSDPYYQVFRHDDKKNMAPLIQPIEIDYKQHDKEKVIVNNRSYLKEEIKPRQFKEEIVNVSLPTKYRIPSFNATFIEDGNDIILQYRSRLPAEDLSKLIQTYLGEDIKINTYQNQNTLVFSGKKESFDYNDSKKKFSRLSNLVNEFDLPAVQVRTKLSIVEYFNDNTYDREGVIDLLDKSMNKILHLNLPSMPDPTIELTTGIEINPFFKTYNLSGVIKFLDSYGKAKVLSNMDVLSSNGETVTFKNTTSIPYPEAVLAGQNLIDTIKYRDTGTTIELTPFANDKGFITIKIPKAETGEQTGWYGAFQRPTFRTADLSTSFVVRDGIPYFAATSLFTRYKEVKRGIPWINKIPILGDMFSSISIENNQSQLLYFLEARIIPRESMVGTRITKVEEEVHPELKEIEEAEGVISETSNIAESNESL